MRAEGPRERSERRGGWSRKASEAELKGNARRERKSLRNGVHHDDAVVWGPVNVKRKGRA